MRDFAELLKAVAWPAVALIALLLLRFQAREIVSETAAKIRRASRIKVGKGGLVLAEEIVRGNILLENFTGTTVQALTSEFEQLAADYDSMKIADVAERVATRHRLANRLGQLALNLKLPRRDLSEVKSEGKLVALATAIQLKPMASDLAAIKRAAQTAEFNFTRYRLVLALVPTLSKGAVNKNTLDQVEEVLHSTENRPNVQTDPPLQRLIDKTRETVSDLRDTL